MMKLRFLRPEVVPQRSTVSAPMVLSDTHIIETIARLQRRIGERFPDSGLASLCGQLLDVARQASTRSTWIGRPILWVRITGYLLAVGVIALLVHTLSLIGLETEPLTFTEFIQTFEAGMNEVLLVGAAIYFLVSVEVRIKRRRALAAVHELRSIAHIIDMHQLTKDPERVLRSWQQAETSPVVRMSPRQLGRYLDYCSEMLSLTGKIAALYVREFDDAASVAAVGEVEQLSTGLSRKIWQKIMILSQLEVAGDLAPPGAPSLAPPPDARSGPVASAPADCDSSTSPPSPREIQ